MASTAVARPEVPSPGAWKIDPAHHHVGFVARHLMVTKVRGRFADVDGVVRIAERPEDSSVEVRIGSASLDTGNPDRDAHLRSPDFLEVERYPELRFTSTKVEVTGPTSLKLHGDLTVRDVTRPVVLDVEYEGLSRGPRGDARVGFSATTRIDREDWGLTWNVTLETGGWLVSKDVDLEIDVELKQDQPIEQVA